MKNYCGKCPELDLSKSNERYMKNYYWCNKFGKWRLAHDECLNERIEPEPKEPEIVPTVVKKILKKIKKKIPKPEPPIQEPPEVVYEPPIIPDPILEPIIEELIEDEKAMAIKKLEEQIKALEAKE